MPNQSLDKGHPLRHTHIQEHDFRQVGFLQFRQSPKGLTTKACLLTVFPAAEPTNPSLEILSGTSLLPDRTITPTCENSCQSFLTRKGLAMFCSTNHLDFIVSTALQCHFNVILKLGFFSFSDMLLGQHNTDSLVNSETIPTSEFLLSVMYLSVQEFPYDDSL